MIQLTLSSGLKVLYRNSDILAVMEYEHKDSDDKPEVNSIVTINLWTLGNSAPTIHYVLVRESIDTIYRQLQGAVLC